jgi:hypothetical protein
VNRWVAASGRVDVGAVLGLRAVSLRIKGHGAEVKRYRLKAHAKHLGGSVAS